LILEEETTFKVVGHVKFPVVRRLLRDGGGESFALCPVIEFWNPFLPLLHHSSDTTKDNFKLTHMM